jgi:hypothetical protein
LGEHDALLWTTGGILRRSLEAWYWLPLDNANVTHSKGCLKLCFDLASFSKTFDLGRLTVSAASVNKLAPVDHASLEYAHRFVPLLPFVDFDHFAFSCAARALRLQTDALCAHA